MAKTSVQYIAVLIGQCMVEAMRIQRTPKHVSAVEWNEMSEVDVGRTEEIGFRKCMIIELIWWRLQQSWRLLLEKDWHLVDNDGIGKLREW